MYDWLCGKLPVTMDFHNHQGQGMQQLRGGFALANPPVPLL
jgi:hypothetical protein